MLTIDMLAQFALNVALVGAVIVMVTFAIVLVICVLDER